VKENCFSTGTHSGGRLLNGQAGVKGQLLLVSLAILTRRMKVKGGGCKAQGARWRTPRI
jgi:hypothetical protein